MIISMELEMDITKFCTVTIDISSKIRCIEGKFHIKWEKGIIKVIQCSTFKFMTTDMITAIDKVKFLLDSHPKEYFSNISIKSNVKNNLY